MSTLTALVSKYMPVRSLKLSTPTRVLKTCKSLVLRTPYVGKRWLRPSRAFNDDTAKLSTSTENLLDQQGVLEQQAYAESFLRAFLLGIGSGVLFEGLHVALQFLGLAEDVGVSEVFSKLLANPVYLEQFQPLLVSDHVAGGFGWLLFYLIDCIAIKTVIDTCIQYKEDPDAIGNALRNLVTIPRIMMPVRLALFKHFFFPNTAFAVGGSSSPVTGKNSNTSTITEEDDMDGSFFASNAVLDAPPAVNTGSSTSSTVKPPPPRRSLPQQPKPRPKGSQRPLSNIKVMNPPTIPKSTRPSTKTSPKPLKEEEVDSIMDRKRAQELAEKRAKMGLKPGQLDTNSTAGLIARRKKELSDRQTYLKNFWYAVAPSDMVKPNEPYPVEMLGRKLVLFRDTSNNGQVNCLEDVCPHRAAPLSSGPIKRIDGHDCVTCGYHGWAVSADGRLRDVPAAEEKGAWPKRPIVEKFTIEEKGGFIWLFNGSKDIPAEERPPIPYVPELDAPGWKAVYGEIEFDCNHHAVFENAIDMAHIHYLHGDSFGNEDKPEIRDMKVSSDDLYSITATFTLHNKPVSALWEFSKVDAVHVTAKAFLPSTSVISFTLGNGLSFITFVNTVPVGPNKTVNKFALVRNLAWDKSGMFNARAWDSWARKAMLRILGEDKVMVEQLRADLLPVEFSVRADLPQVAFRKLRQQWVDLGYGMDPKSIGFGKNCQMGSECNGSEENLESTGTGDM